MMTMTPKRKLPKKVQSNKKANNQLRVSKLFYQTRLMMKV